MNGLALRSVTVVEAALIARLHGDCFDDPWRVDGVRTLLATPGAFGFLVDSRGAVGSSAFVPDGFAVARLVADECELLAIGVLKGARGRGVGRFLLGAILEHASKGGGREMFLEVATDNAVACRLYERHGFTVVGFRRAYYRRADRTYGDAAVMRCALDPDI